VRLTQWPASIGVLVVSRLLRVPIAAAIPGQQPESSFPQVVQFERLDAGQSPGAAGGKKTILSSLESRRPGWFAVLQVACCGDVDW